ncbi:MAG: homocysteine S-methyltransferase family protein [Gammaproteobacteria bacterium]|nr:homocysteine S-methyltransferase family protein [Gammaproteobacteria bacterium]
MPGNAAWLEQRLAGMGPPLVIDGGMGTELQKQGVPMDRRVWSATANLTHPDAVRAAHEAFIRAGAEVIITNTFSAGRHMLEPAGFGDRVHQINLNAVRAACLARDSAATGPVAIAGSICEWTTDGDSDWNSPRVVGESAREQAQLLAEAGVDLIALEMCERLEYTVAVVEAALGSGLPVWIGVSARVFPDLDYVSVFDLPELDFETLVRGVAGYPAALMAIMHTPVPDVSRAWDIVRRYWEGPVGIYPESGYFSMPNWNFVDIIEAAALVAAARTWIDAGARMVGGCCGLGPAHIAALHQAFGRERGS